MELLEQDWCRDLYLALCDWRELDHFASNITARLNRYAIFFEQLDQNFLRPDQIDQKGLLAVFKPEGLRRNSVPVRFLIERLNLSWSTGRKDEVVEMRRINQILESCPDDGRRQLLADYLGHLNERSNEGGLSRRTIRGYMRAISRLLESVGSASPERAWQSEVDRFLRRHPGYRASITPFAAYLRQRRGRHVRVPASPRPSRDTVSDLMEEVQMIAQRINADPGHEKARALVARLISRLYAIPLEHVLRMRRRDLTGGDDCVTFLLVHGERVRLEPFVRDLLSKYALPLGKNDYLFPGRNPSQSLTASAVWYHVNLLGQEAAAKTE